MNAAAQRKAGADTLLEQAGNAERECELATRAYQRYTR